MTVVFASPLILAGHMDNMQTKLIACDVCAQWYQRNGNVVWPVIQQLSDGRWRVVCHGHLREGITN